jgi:hypothetical protein
LAPAEASRKTGPAAPCDPRIAELAYSYWEARGRPGGSPWEDWFRAERELMAKLPEGR